METVSRRNFLVLMLGGTVAALVGCAPSVKTPSEGLVAWPAKDQWPEPLWGQAKPEVREAYRYALAHPEVLQYIPCYCGCVNDGHTSNKDCYIDEVRPDGSVLLDSMSFG